MGDVRFSVHVCYVVVARKTAEINSICFDVKQSIELTLLVDWKIDLQSTIECVSLINSTHTWRPSVVKHA